MRRFALPSSIIAAAVVGAAAPALAAGDAAPPSFAGLALRAGLSLGAVLAAIIALAALLRRVGHSAASRGSGGRLASVARLDLGSRREIRMVRAEGRTLVVGVTADRIQLLAELPPAVAESDAEDRPALRVLRELTTSS